MATLATYRRMTGDIEEAERIARLLQAEFNADFDTLRNDFRELNRRSNIVAKWNAIVEELKAEPAETPLTQATPDQSSPANAPRQPQRSRATPAPDTKPAS